MKLNRASLVFTTIFDPSVLEDLFNNFSKFNHLHQVDTYVIPDLKTPKEAYKRCEELNKRGMKISCPTPEEQEAFLKKVRFASNLIPYNSDNRRNIGFLMALETQNQFLISIDDDNFCHIEEDFFAGHEIVCSEEIKDELIKTNDGWYNICEQLEFTPDVKIYPRGFPYFSRHKERKIEQMTAKVRLAINQGLWLQDPDIDGISWLVNPAKVRRFKGNSFILDKNTWSPINTQNTSLRSEVIPAYYFIRMGYPLAGIPIDRYGDIFSGYFAEACARNMDEFIRFGTPIVSHNRNSHNYLNDASNEWACVMVLEDLLPWLKEVTLNGKDYMEIYTNLSLAIEDAVESFKGKIWTDATRGYFHQVAYSMRKWIDTVKVLTGKA